MTEEQKEQLVRVQVLAVVARHPVNEDQLMIQLNEDSPPEQRINFCLACAQTFIGLAADLLDRPKSALEESGIVVPKLGLRGPLK